MKRAALLFPLGLCASFSTALAQDMPCDHLEDPSWIEWTDTAQVKSDGRLLSLNLDDSGTPDLVLLPTRSAPVIPHVMLDVDRWMRGGGLSSADPVDDVAQLQNEAGSDSLLSACSQGLAYWALGAEQDHFQRIDLVGPWTALSRIETHVTKGNPWGVLAALDGQGTTIHLQALWREDVTSSMNLGTMTSTSEVDDFALIDFVAGDGTPELVVLDDRGLTIFDLAGLQLYPSLPITPGESAQKLLTPIERTSGNGEDIYWITTDAAGRGLNFLDSAGVLSRVSLLGLTVNSLQIEDLDDNGVPDMALFDEDFGLFLMINNPEIGNASFIDRDLILLDSMLSATPMLLLDLDHDSDLDLVADGRIFAGQLVDRDLMSPTVNPDSFTFGVDKSSGPLGGMTFGQDGGLSSLPQQPVGRAPSPTAPAHPTRPLHPVRPLHSGGHRAPGQEAPGQSNDGAKLGTTALVLNVDAIQFDLLNLGLLQEDVTELMIDVHVELSGDNEQLTELPVASISVPVSSTINLSLSPRDDVLYHYFSIRPRRVVQGEATWAYPTISFRWRPEEGADANYTKQWPPTVCAEEGLFRGRSGPVPVIPVTFLGSWPSYF